LFLSRVKNSIRHSNLRLSPISFHEFWSNCCKFTFENGFWGRVVVRRHCWKYLQKKISSPFFSSSISNKWKRKTILFKKRDQTTKKGLFKIELYNFVSSTRLKFKRIQNWKNFFFFEMGCKSFKSYFTSIRTLKRAKCYFMAEKSKTSHP